MGRKLTEQEIKEELKKDNTKLTNHIEEMMKAAGVKPRFYMEVDVGDLDCNFQEVSEKTLKKLWENWGFHLQCSDYWWEDEEKESIPENFVDFKKSDFWEKRYPPFTPAKQLEIIKLMVDKCKDIKISKFQDTYTIRAYEDWGDYIYNSSELNDFTETIAQVTHTLISFNELDKAEVKRVLEDD